MEKMDDEFIPMNKMKFNRNLLIIYTVVCFFAVYIITKNPINNGSVVDCNSLEQEELVIFLVTSPFILFVIYLITKIVLFFGERIYESF